MPTYHDNVLSWASDIEPDTIEQAQKTAQLPFIHGHVALMPDAHVGMGSTVGSVIPTAGAIIPAAIGVDIGCVDADTEFLSPGGWRKISLYAGEQVMQFHPETGVANFTTPLRYIRREQDTFLSLQTKYGINQQLTPDHRVLVWNRVGRDRRDEMTVLSAAEYAERHHDLVQGNKARFETAFTPIERPGLLLDDDQIRVMVMFVADGSIDGSRGVCRFKKARKIDRTAKLLDAASIDYTVNTGKDGVTTYRFTPPVLDKNFYAACWVANADQLRVISDECIHWDGNEKDQVFFSRNKTSADFIHYAFAATGNRAVLREDIDASDGGIDYRVFRYPESMVSMAGVPRSDIVEVPSTDGFAYCFTVPSGFLVLRRGGNIFTTGNCGMSAVELPLSASDLPDNLDPLLSRIGEVIPAGVGKGHDSLSMPTELEQHMPDAVINSGKLWKKSQQQMGTLGSGNHFVEVCLDERDVVWLVLHSGSRGVGNELAKIHIEGAKKLMERYFINLEDRDLSYLVEGTPEFDAYIEAMLWAQDYALWNRRTMMDNLLGAFEAFMDRDIDEVQRVNCHHNFTVREHHGGRNVWLTRKGAIRARVGDLGVIPGSMGTRSYIVEGLGNESSYHSCSHGAGRRMSRAKARKTLTVDSFREAMGDRTWLSGQAEKLLDEHPASYKDIDVVMNDQKDLVQVRHTLRQILNFKGV